MIRFAGKTFLLDIEGTTSSISYVVDTMFPYVRQRLADFLSKRFDDAEMHRSLQQMALDNAYENLEDWVGVPASDQSRWIQAVSEKVLELMDRDAKQTGLKKLQGQIWKAGFESGELVGHVFPDVAPALKDWTARGRSVHIYSSGSVQAQKLYFGHSEAGDLLPFIAGHHDTSSGPKKEPGSYRQIAGEVGLAPEDFLFLSDSVAELDAASSAGMATAHTCRPGNPAPPSTNHPTITTFQAIQLVDA